MRNTSVGRTRAASWSISSYKAKPSRFWRKGVPGVRSRSLVHPCSEVGFLGRKESAGQRDPSPGE